MDILIKDLWSKENITDYYDILHNYKRDNKINWTKNIINTSMDLLAILSGDIKSITNYIYKGNYISFLDLMPHKYYEDTIICANLISKIKDFDLQKKYILKLSKYIDNWSTVDSLKYNVKKYEEEYLLFSKELISDNNPFKRRIGIRIFFNYKNNNKYLNKIIPIIINLKGEEDYYVNMAIAWFLCELFIYNKEIVYNLLVNKNLNKFVNNKTISKCKDSFRISKEDKEILSNYRIN